MSGTVTRWSARLVLVALFCLVAPAAPAQVQKGSKPYVTILCRFADSVNETPHPKSWYDGVMGSVAPGMDHYWREVSLGNIDLKGSVVVGWYNLPHDKAFYMVNDNLWHMDEKKVLADATAVANADVDFSKFYGINVMLNVDVAGVSVGWSRQWMTLDGETRGWGATILPITKQDHATIAHEMGHSLGLPHSCGPYFQIYDSKWDDMSGGFLEPGDPTYGKLGNHTIAYHKDKLGWIPLSRKYLAAPNSSQTISIERLANPVNTNNYLMAQIFLGGLGTQFYTVEARQKTGYDNNGLPGDCIVIHKVDVNAVEPAKVVDPDGNGNPNDDGAMWTPGETFTDTSNNVTIKVNSVSGTAYSVTITVGNTPPPYIVTNTLDDGAGSLRNALSYCNQVPGSAIQFKIPATDYGYSNGVFTIKPGKALPEIVAAGTVIDGGTQTAFGGDSNPNGPEILIDGSLAGVYSSGFTITAPSCVIRNLAIGRFDNSGISIYGPVAGGNTVQSCYLGADPNGTSAAGNNWGGIAIWGGAPNNLIGGAAPGQGNLISGNGQVGVSINDFGSSGNLVQGNRIGTNSAGTAALPNGWGGVSLQTGAQNNTVGGLVAGARNVISGNKSYGVGMARSDEAGRTTSNNKVQGNYIGTNAAGTAALPNGYAGIGIFDGAQGNTVGGGTLAAANLLSGNANVGVAIAGTGTTGNLVQNNYIGTNYGGTVALGNGWGGVQISGGAQGNVVGGSGTGNILSGNGQVGISLNDVGTDNNVVQGNMIGVNAAGSAAVPNGWGGVLLYGGAKGNTIGGSSAGARNVISGNVSYGVGLNGAEGNTVQGNYIGTDGAGTAALQNGYAGVGLFGGSKGNLIGGAAAAQGNVISGNASSGVRLEDTGTTGNKVQGNRIGTSAAGTAALPNGMAGVSFAAGAQKNLVGGTNPGEGNIIAFHANEGIVLQGDAGAGNTLRGNRIYGNGRLAIDLAGGTEDTYGVTTNDVGDADAGPNNLQNSPTISKVILSGGMVTVTGSISTTPNTTLAIDLYGLTNARKHVSGRGGTESYLGSATVVTNGSGVGTFTVTGKGPVAGDLVCLAATNTATGDTSELGPNAAVPAATVTLASLTLSPDSVNGGSSATGTVTLTDPAPGGGASVALTSGNPAVAGVPATVSVAAGATSASFPVSTSSVAAQTGVTIGGSYGGVTQGAGLTVKPLGVASLTLTPASLLGGNKSTGAVTLMIPAPVGGAVVTLSSSNPDVAAPPATVTVPAGSTSTTFQIVTVGVAADTDVTIGATWNTISKSAVLTVKAADLASVTLGSPSVTSGLKVTGTVTLNGAAPSGGRNVTLSSDKAAATVPASVNVPGGQTKAVFTVTTSTVSAKTVAKVTAKLGATVKSADLAVLPYNPADLTGDGNSDLVLQNQADRRILLQSLDKAKVVAAVQVTPTLPENWRVAAAGDFDRDRRTDLVVQNTATRAISILFLEGAAVRASVSVFPVLSENWQLMASADVNKDGKPDLVVQNVVTQQVSVLTMDGTKIVNSLPLSANLNPGWKVVGMADFNGDGSVDMVIQNLATRQISVLTLNGVKITGGIQLLPVLPEGWAVGAVGDYDGDGKPDLVVQNGVTRQVSILTVVAIKITSSLPVTPTPQEGWKLVGPK